MVRFIEYMSEFNTVTVLTRLIIAALVGGIIGTERGRHGRAAGLRTHILICLGAAITSLTSLYLSEALGYSSDIARLSAQVISGIGFLGAGTIMIRNSSVITGLTTAAGMWATAAMGVAVGYGFYAVAIFATLICILSFTLLSRLEADKRRITHAYIELSDIGATQIVVSMLQSSGGLVSYDISNPRSGHAQNVGIFCNLKSREHFDAIKEELENTESLVMILDDINN